MRRITVGIGPDGPLIPLGVLISGPRHAALQAAGLPLPPPVRINGLIDTGASGTAVDRAVLSRLQIPPSGSAQILTPSTGSTPHSCNEYDVAIALILDQNDYHIIQTIPVIESNFPFHNYDALIGRDVLAQCLMIYDGVANTLTLTF